MNYISEKKQIATVALVTLSPNTHRTAEENLGIGYLASSLRKNNFSVVIIDGWLENLSEEEVFTRISSNETIDIVGISCYMSNNDSSIELAEKIKKYNHNIHVICGGFGPTFTPEKFVSANRFEVAIIGEGENTIVEVCKALINKTDLSNIKGIVYTDNESIYKTEKNTQILDLDTIDFPARDTIKFALERKSTINVLTSRGCNGNCTFCSINAFWKLSKGCKWRGRSVKNIVDELEKLYKMGIRHIKFVDDSFIDGDRDSLWAKSFYEEVKKRKIKIIFRGSIRADKVTDGIIKYLKKAGFTSFACGIENGSPTALKRMNKSAQLNSNKKALEILKKYGILVQAGYILFDDKTTLKELKENVVFLEEHDEIIIKGIFSEMFAANGTIFTEKLKNKNKISKIEIYENNKYEILDETVRILYDYIKKWHKAHMHIYDKIVDPISTPKAISTEDAIKFYQIYLKIKVIDITFLKKIINLDENSIDKEKIEKFYVEYMDSTQASYLIALKEAEMLYKTLCLNYDAKINPFIN